MGLNWYANLRKPLGRKSVGTPPYDQQKTMENGQRFYQQQRKAIDHASAGRLKLGIEWDELATAAGLPAHGFPPPQRMSGRTKRGRFWASPLPGLPVCRTRRPHTFFQPSATARPQRRTTNSIPSKTKSGTAGPIREAAVGPGDGSGGRGSESDQRPRPTLLLEHPPRDSCEVAGGVQQARHAWLMAAGQRLALGAHQHFV